MHKIRFIILLFFIGVINILSAQPITGVWKGKINNKRVEVKLVQKGDSITGTSYYPNLLKGHRRYSIKGYFDNNTGSIVWWDDQLIYPKEPENKDARAFFVADFSCPGPNRMFLNNNPRNNPITTVSLTKVPYSGYTDEWDFVLDNYQYGGNDPRIIDSVALVAFREQPPKEIFLEKPKEEPVARKTEPKPAPAPETKPALVFLERKDLQKPKQEEKKTVNPPAQKPKPEEKVVVAKPKPEKPVETKKPTPKPEPVVKKEEPVVKITEPKLPPKPVTNEDRFTSRTKEFALEIPISGDSIELRFYDNAEVDGDSISLFLNNKLLFEHIRLTTQPYTIKLSVKDLGPDNELVMVAENLGSIPPNTAYMVVMVGEKRHEAQIVSTEETSALIRLRKEL